MPPEMKTSTTRILVMLPLHLTHRHNISRHKITPCPFVPVATPHVSTDGYSYSNDKKISLLILTILHSLGCYRTSTMEHGLPFSGHICIKRSHAYKTIYHLALLVHTDWHPKPNDMRINIKLKNVHHVNMVYMFDHHVKKIIHSSLIQIGVVPSSSWSPHNLLLTELSSSFSQELQV
jgi:hypothetical protein